MRRSATIPPKSGTKFNKLTVLGEAIRGPEGNYIPCQCECGVPVFVLWRILNNGKKDCGQCKITYRAERLYNIWSQMKGRCYNPNNQRYSDYGGRGITVCPAWRGSYHTFRAWALSHGYTDELTIERLDVDSSYEPGNCAWIPRNEQSKNRRSAITITYDRECKILKEWSEDPRCKVSYSGLYRRVTSGWPFEAALTSPAGSRRPKMSLTV